MIYDNQSAVRYALRYALHPNPDYVYYQGNDCTNFISQCLRAGGCKNDFNDTHPWWYAGGQSSVCWAVAHSLYWYIRENSKKNRFGIKAITHVIGDMSEYGQKIEGKVAVGDIIQYRNFEDRIQHSAIITSFDPADNEPLVCHHTFEALNITWRKPFKEYIFHHITSIN